MTESSNEMDISDKNDDDNAFMTKKEVVSNCFIKVLLLSMVFHHRKKVGGFPLSCDQIIQLKLLL